MTSPHASGEQRPIASDLPDARGVPALPKTWHPRRARKVTLGIAFLTLLILGTISALLPSAGNADLRLADRIGMFCFGIVVASVLVKQALVHATASAEGLHVVNLLRHRHLAWGEILAVTLRRGDPWVTLDLSDGQTIAVMGIQASDGAAAPAAARELAALVRAYSPASPQG